jgi:hypothetical protein
MKQPITRRGLLGGSLGLWTAGARAARVSKIKFGLTSYQWGADWDIPTMIANCTKAKAMGVELRTSAKYKHGVELDLGAEQRREVKKQFAGSPVKLVGINSAERFDWPDAAALRAAIENAKAHVKLAHDTGATGIRVFPNNFHAEVPEAQTLAQIAKSLNALGKFARDYGTMVRLENHGPVGTLANLRKIMDQVEQKNVRIKLNGDKRDNEGGRFAQNFALIQDRLGDTLHMRMYRDTEFPYQTQWDLLTAAGWDGWCFVEESVKVPDRVQALIEEREMW